MAVLTVSNVLVSPGEAQELLEQGYTYVDVRSELEFALARPPHACNVPWQQVLGDRLVQNSEFARVMCAAFRTTDPLIVGCRSGSRARAASEELRALGFQRLVQLRHGFEGARDDFGRCLPGWIHSGLGVETGTPAPGQSYAGLRARYLRDGEQG